MKTTLSNLRNRLLLGGLFVVGSSVLLTSCGVVASNSSQTVDVDAIRKDGFVMAKPIVADVKIENRKIEGTATVKNALYLGNAGQAAKNLAVIDAVKKGDADVIVQPIYKVVSNSTTTTATVIGFAAKYKDFRPYTDDDKLAFDVRIKMNYTSLITVIDAPTEVGASQSKKRGLLKK
jgi:hypothetical protein